MSHFLRYAQRTKAPDGEPLMTRLDEALSEVLRHAEERRKGGKLTLTIEVKPGNADLSVLHSCDVKVDLKRAKPDPQIAYVRNGTYFVDHPEQQELFGKRDINPADVAQQEQQTA